MIQTADIRPIGKLLKTHGVGGELVASSEVSGLDWAMLKCIILMADGIPVPFFIESDRPKSNETSLLKLDGVDTDADAAPLCGGTIYALRSDLDAIAETDDGFYADDLVGFSAVSTDGKLSGTVVGFDDSTANYLLVIRDDAGNDVLVPAVDEFIAAIDVDRRTIELDLPPGLIE